MNTYKEISEEAAKLERQGRYSSAETEWRRARPYATGRNINWVECRADFCAKWSKQYEQH